MPLHESLAGLSGTCLYIALSMRGIRGAGQKEHYSGSHGNGTFHRLSFLNDKKCVINSRIEEEVTDVNLSIRARDPTQRVASRVKPGVDERPTFDLRPRLVAFFHPPLKNICCG